MSSVDLCSTTPRKVIMLLSDMMGLPLESHWKRSCVLTSRWHPSSSYMRRIILRISCSLLLSSSSISEYSSLLACVWASWSSSSFFLALASVGPSAWLSLSSSLRILTVSSVIFSSSWFSSLTNLYSLKFCSSASKNVSTSSLMSFSPVASCSLWKASSNLSTSALLASYFAVSSCSWALCASSSSLPFAFFASSSIRALTCRLRFSSESISESRLRHSASNSCWFFSSSPL
mmetsp:Transcript_37987/g.74233  ORF Transcript_37987/g.74233 Transcript_37987/m.74233 type:complete len:232 (-) Transcript_37987:1063-1758(-)